MVILHEGKIPTVLRYEIDSIDSNIRVNDDGQYYVSYSLCFDDGSKQKHISHPIYARDELEAFTYFTNKMAIRGVSA